MHAIHRSLCLPARNFRDHAESCLTGDPPLQGSGGAGSLNAATAGFLDHILPRGSAVLTELSRLRGSEERSPAEDTNIIECREAIAHAADWMNGHASNLRREKSLASSLSALSLSSAAPAQKIFQKDPSDGRSRLTPSDGEGKAMKGHELVSLTHGARVRAGWDGRAASYFATVIDAGTGKTIFRTPRRDISNFDELEQILSRWAVIDTPLRERLIADRRRSESATTTDLPAAIAAE